MVKKVILNDSDPESESGVEDIVLEDWE
jgi:hypothetical protein